MVKNRAVRVYRKFSIEERRRHEKLRQQIDEELPEIRRRAKGQLARLTKTGTPLSDILSALRAERLRLGLSLADINQRSGIDRAALSRLENDEDANPTLNTLERYAEALGKRVVVLLSDDTG